MEWHSLTNNAQTARYCLTDTARSDHMSSIAIANARIGKSGIALEFADKALKLAQKQGYPYYEAQARYSLGNVSMLSFSMDSAIFQYNKVRGHNFKPAPPFSSHPFAIPWAHG